MKNEHAQHLGRLGGLKGGPARAASLSPAERSEIARKAAQSRWSRVPVEKAQVWEHEADRITEDPNRPQRRCGNRMCFCDGSCMEVQREYDFEKAVGKLGEPLESGLEDIPSNHPRACSDPNHMPGPMLLLIPPGKRYRHVCPTCGKATFVYGSDVRF